MRARILAVFILVVLVVLPVSFYLYFTKQKIAKFVIHASSGVAFTAKLTGSFGVNGLPLADRILSYNQECIDTCIFSPILPARYALTLTASGKTTLSDTITINSGEQVSKTYTFNNDIVIKSVGSIIRDEELPMSLVENAMNKKWGNFIVIGTDIKNRAWVIKNGDTSSQIGLLSTERFAPIRTIPIQILAATIDASKSVIILHLAGAKTLLMPIDISSEKEISTLSNARIISVVPGDIWRIQTDSGTLELKGDRLIDDIRFTNSIDLSPRIRIGYIDKKDTKKLSIANLPLTESVLIRLDRITGASVLLRSGFDIQSLFFYGGEPAYITTSGDIFTIENH